MSKQTALQKAIQSVGDRMNATNNEAIYGELNKVHIILKTLLPYEREVIQSTYRSGLSDGNNEPILRLYDNSTDYFTKTFTDNGND